ncbi:MAG: hypothetical protein QMC95_14195 [Desulfitobacteriaceae bacterium]|nr:hypothetical protein [Desulfitobacteriaceae bacterium]MDI6915345.1 hypothetical protein [Desulfitobacteriaceae bacterium]
MMSSEETPSDHDFARGQDSARALEVSEVLLRDSPWPLNLLPHEPISVAADARKNSVFSFVGPHYHDGWRLQFISQKRGKNGTFVKLEFANTGSKTIVLTRDNLKLFMPNNPASSVGSSFQDSPMTIQPGKIKILNIVSPNPQASGLRIRIGDYSRTVRLERFEDPILNTRPFFAPRELIGPESQPITRKTMEVTGAGKFKYQPMGIQYTSNKALGKLVRPENGMLLLLKVRLANTWLESMHIDHFTIGSWNSKSNKPSQEYVLTPQDLRTALKEWALPTDIPAQTLVEGYIPFFVQDTNEYLYILAESNLGNFEFRNMDAFLPLDFGSV